MTELVCTSTQHANDELSGIPETASVGVRTDAASVFRSASAVPHEVGHSMWTVWKFHSRAASWA